MTLDILQNGNVVTTLNGQANGSKFCFPIDPSSIPGLDTNAGSFDFIATAQFAIGATVLASKTVNSVVDGIPPYEIVCDSAGCCTGPNLVTNGSFDRRYRFLVYYTRFSGDRSGRARHYASSTRARPGHLSSWSVKESLLVSARPGICWPSTGYRPSGATRWGRAIAS